jgi:8-amino-7-oxononanoate synthase
MPRRSPERDLESLARRDLKRTRRTLEITADEGAVISVDGRRLVNFSGNDYLGLARHPQVVEALTASATRTGAGSGASHLITGHGVEHQQLEEELAAFTGRERALLFSTGYMANLAAVAAFAGRGDLVALDRLSHASLIDAALLSRARMQRYAHADAEAARRMLERYPAEHDAVVATDGVFSMDGDVAPVAELASAAREHRAWLIVDDAHGLGVTGGSGRGTLEQFGLGQDDVPLLVGTLGKAFGCFGAFVAGRADVVEYLMQKARSYIYTTALPQCVAAATRAALALSQSETWRRERVHALVARFRAAAAAQGVPLSHSQTPIQPVPLGTERAALQASRDLEAAGFCVTAIRPPTVPQGGARLRVSLSAAHTDADVDALVEALARVSATLRSGL